MASFTSPEDILQTQAVEKRIRSEIPHRLAIRLSCGKLTSALWPGRPDAIFPPVPIVIDYRLHVFRTVAESLHFTRAAAALHISQPAVTQHVKALEESYGVALFHRGGGRIPLTAAGEILLDHANRVHDLDREVEALLRAGQPLLSGPLRLGTSSTVGQYLLPRCMAAFRSAHPQVELSLEIGNTSWKPPAASR